ncbi:prolipoprotein diacylglyceryl transferase [Aquella oligotrophica]|uniref:Phosphatidylglycerol--prolipoprotein diacylglyceryl transferase n=1 Tax=Aquella oligotrophica TaxID=2067065 RepID=A0A2I7N2V3_9NEIS|nr:prolipoprotein diacylglyceryl transferase [Aquella oligotrophica]AUR50778.1 prolipoprotein diacylglyceryl transferase [Aquella oligotrophica]
MLMYPKFDPVAISLGPIKVHWYGLMYLLSFLLVLYVGKWRIRKFGHPVLTEKMVDDFLFYGALGTVLGGRIGYCLFYQPAYYLTHPLDIVKTWDGGMSFHGGIIGVCIGIYLFTRKEKMHFFVLGDFVALIIPLCLMLGRIGNFINGELWGRFCSPNLPWGMVFPQSGSMLPRHPSQLYEALTEGIILFTVILIFRLTKERNLGQTSGVFLIGYGLARFVLEFFRAPDAFATGVVQATGLSLGQLYSFPMILIGIIVFVWGLKSRSTVEH